MKKINKKLTIKTTTVRDLTSTELFGVVGGAPTSGTSVKLSCQPCSGQYTCARTCTE